MARPSTLPRWATTGLIVEPTEDKKDAGWLTGEKPPAQYENWLLNLLSRWVGFFNTSLGSGLFGDGSDGDVSLDGSVAAPSWGFKVGSVYRLQRDVYCNDLELTGTAEIATFGFRLFCAGTLTIGASCAVQCDGADASGHTAASGTNAGGSLGFGQGGGSGGVSGTPNGGAGTGLTTSLGGSGGAGSAGFGSSTAGTGGAAGTTVVPAAALGGARSLWSFQSGFIIGLSSFTPAIAAIFGGAGGGGGGRAVSGSDASNGGGGGGGGGVIVLAAAVIVNEGRISADGGAGGNSAITNGSGDNAGGGGGGGGGVIKALTSDYSGSGTMTAAAGAGGTGGPGTGSNGSPGVAGLVDLFDLSLAAGTGALGPHEESGNGAMSSGPGTGDGIDYLDVVFGEAFSAINEYVFDFNAYSYTGVSVTLVLVDKTITGMRIQPSAPFDGEISWSARSL